jgi:diguanylate cyclase (GGDEF)-like protein
MPEPQVNAINAVSRLMAATVGGARPDAVRRALVREARELLGAEAALLVAVANGEGVAQVVAADPESGAEHPRVAIAAVPALKELIELRRAATRAGGDQARALAEALGAGIAPGLAVVLPVRSQDTVDHALVLLDGPGRSVEPGDIDVAAAFANACGAVIAQTRLADEQAARVAQQAALARAAKTLNESLDLSDVLHSICTEAVRILDADAAALYRGSAEEGLTIEAAVGQPPELLGLRLPPGEGLSGRVVQADRAMLTNDYQRIATPRPDGLFDDLIASMAVPMHWDGALRGVLSVGYRGTRFVNGQDLALLETFAELAAVACRNASAATGLALAAHTDGLTGCLNHAALQDGLRREIERCARTGQELSLVLLDLDDFKQVNEGHGHLVGDEVLRRAGHALRMATRPYDLVARYGGDEFAILAVDADEHAALEIAARAVERMREAIEDLGSSGATAGIAQWDPSQTPTQLIEQADRALMFGKQENGRGTAQPASDLPAGFRPGRFKREHDEPAAPESPRWTGGHNPESDRLQRRTRHLVMANNLGTRLSAMTRADEVLDAVVDELHRAFGYYICHVVRLRAGGVVQSVVGRGEMYGQMSETHWEQPITEGVIGRCLRERHVIVVPDTRQDPDFTENEEIDPIPLSELCAPVWVGDELWGAINVEEIEAGAFDEDDARLLQTVADQLGSALRSALLYEQLDRAYLGTAEALAAALEAKDSYTAHHAHSIVQWAEAVGRRLGMDERQLRTLRYGAVFHDIGKIAIPEAILNKRGPLNEAEREIMERHTIVGEQILAPVEFLADVRPIVRHEHERWDGGGYPDGLRGEQIPLGARIVLVCDAYHAMTSDRPYRAAMSEADARAELRAGAGTQFDPRVVDGFLAVLDAGVVAR